MSRQGKSPWHSNERVREQRMCAERNRDTRDFSGRGRYLKKDGGPGRGPYSWREYLSSAEYAKLKRETNPEDGSITMLGFEDEGWVRCPSTSHVEATKIIYSLDPNGPLLLKVLFREGKGQRLYTYVSDDGRQSRLEFIGLLLQSSEHPGEVVWSHLISEQFEYY